MTVSPSGLEDAAHKQTTHPLGEAMDVCLTHAAASLHMLLI